MLLRIFLIATSYAWFCHGAASMAKPSTNGQISDIFSRIQIYDGKILQFEVNWNDTLPPDTTYNVIVNPMNLTECPDLPCSVYGISKPSNDLLIPDQPMSYVESMECNYMLGCNYTLTVENSNAAVSKTQPIAIPYCVEQLCSCQHWKMLPPVNAVVNVTNNQTIEISWNIDLHALQTSSQLPAAIQELTLSSIYLKLSKQTNPSLSWGGKHIPIAEHLYPIENGSHALALAAANLLKGSFEVEVSEALPPKTVLFLRTYVIDSLGCDGPEEIVKTEVPAQSVPFVELMSTDFDLRVGLIVITTLFVLLMGTALAFFIWRRQKAKCDSQIDQDEQYFAPLAAVIEMEDNINYVDKDIEDAQVKGLADIFEVPHHAIRMGPEIGEGAFGRVYQATATNIRRMRGTTVVAVKQLKKNPTEDEVDEFLSEIEMLKGVGTHYNIVSFLGCCTIRPPYLMIMEFVGRGDLLSYLRIVRQEASKFKSRDANYVSQNGKRQQQEQQQLKPPVVPVSYIELKVSEESIYDEAEEERRPKPSVAETTYTIIDSNDRSEIVEPFQYILNHKELHNFAMQIANGMRFLEEQEVTHRDLAARNVLIDDNKTLKISDFGLSRHGIYTNTKTRKLPLRWLSIEAIRDNLYSNKSDVWAFGVVLWEIGTLGASPYPTISNSELIPFLLSGQRLEKPEICTDEVYKIMQQCWLEDPDERPTFEKLYKMLSPKTTYVDINSLSDDYVFPPISNI